MQHPGEFTYRPKNLSTLGQHAKYPKNTDFYEGPSRETIKELSHQIIFSDLSNMFPKGSRYLPSAEDGVCTIQVPGLFRFLKLFLPHMSHSLNS